MDHIEQSAMRLPDSLPKLAQVADIDAFWAIDEAYASAAMEKLSGLTIAEAAALQAEFLAKSSKSEPSERKPYEKIGKTAIIAIDGPMTKKPTSASFLFGGTSTIETRDSLRKAATDPDVEAVLLQISSPGGQVDGTAELGDDVREFGKPILAFIDGICCSGAYWVASQADAVYAGRTAMTGSIGVKMAPLYDTSRLYAMMGVEAHQLTSGDLKSVGDRGMKVTPEQIRYMKGLTTGLLSEFKDAVQTGRGMDDETFAKVADGRVILAREALTLGLIDGICSLEECLSTISSGDLPGAQPAASNGRQETTSMANDGNKPSLGDRLIAFFKGEGIDIEAAGGGTTTVAALPNPTAQVITVPDPALAKQLAEQSAQLSAFANGLLDQEAKSFVNSLCSGAEAKEIPAEAETIEALFKAAVLADGGGVAKLGTDGKLFEGNLTGLIRKREESRKPHGLLAQMVGDLPEGELFVLNPNNKGKEEMTPERRANLRKKMGLPVVKN